MKKYILKRLLFFVFTFFGVSMIIFFLSNFRPYDPTASRAEGEEQLSDRAKPAMLEKLYLDLPLFYFNVTTQAYSDTLYKIQDLNHRENLKRLIAQYGNWQAIEAYYTEVKDFNYQLRTATIRDENRALISDLSVCFPSIITEHRAEEIERIFKTTTSVFEKDTTNTPLLLRFNTIKEKYALVQSSATPFKNYLPAFHFYGTNNQYHIWISKFVRLDFGKSYNSETLVLDLIKQNLFWTLFLSLISIVLAYALSIWLGVLMATKKGTMLESVITTSLFALFSLPSFWVGTLMIVFLTNPNFVEWFPPGGTHDMGVEGLGWWQQLGNYAHHLVLPIICWTYPTLAFLSRQMRNGMLSALGQDYIRTAKAKGLSPRQVIWKHGFRNALIPIITMLGNVLPSLVAGSIVLEYVFNIEGMGMLLYNSIMTQNYPVVFAIVMLVSVLTMLGYLLSDILYAYADPRVRFKR